MQIDEVELCGQKFRIISDKTITPHDGTVWNYRAIIDDIEFDLNLKATGDIIDSLELVCGIDFQKELRIILLREIRMEIFSKLHPEFFSLMTWYSEILE